ncbi:MAG: FprA family A-type flavoprotein [Bacteroides sp.]|nr:FprA family A-type flavoprotein [Prevotella sp.]MCM1407170.1 FprA family A-type flavoprotein [Treponema brennaborense]MCM1470322.1 FprA family A-type flavoprotein [Bacteroides sp.]
MNAIAITDSVKYAGVDDRTIDLFESQYVVPNGVSYNSYVIIDEKTAVLDSVDKRAAEQWLANLEAALGGKTPDYLIVSHLEPDHSGSIMRFAEKYPSAQLVMSARAQSMLPQFFTQDMRGRCTAVKEGDELCLGAHTLVFVMAPMVHWPEVMVTYEKSEKILFSADAFGKFGALDADEDWTCEARRYYCNIVGKYGAQVQALLKKAAALDIRTICPLHGPILKENLSYYIDKYAVWSSYEAEEAGIFIAYASIHGNTAAAAEELARILRSKGAPKVTTADLAREDMAEAVEDAFRYDRLVLASATYDAGLFPCMESFLAHLKSKNYQKRTVGIIENGSWAPAAARLMAEQLSGMKDIAVLAPTVTIKSTLNAESAAQLEALACALLA